MNADALKEIERISGLTAEQLEQLAHANATFDGIDDETLTKYLAFLAVTTNRIEAIALSILATLRQRAEQQEENTDAHNEPPSHNEQPTPLDTRSGADALAYALALSQPFPKEVH